MSNQIRLAGIINDSIVDGPGLRLVIFTQGCHMACPGCHNKDTWDVNAGSLYEIDNIQEMWKQNPLTMGITISGGEPFLQIGSILKIVKKAVKDKLNIIIFTGYQYENLLDRKNRKINKILDNIDYLIDGPFILDKKDLTLLFRGSSNQRIIDIKKTKKQNKIVLMDEGGYEKK